MRVLVLSTFMYVYVGTSFQMPQASSTSKEAIQVCEHLKNKTENAFQI